MTMVSSAVPRGTRAQVSNDQNIKLTLVIGDDHLVFLDALSDVLGQQNFSVRAASTLSGIIDAVADGRPDVCLIDRRFCRPDGPDIWASSSPRARAPISSCSAPTRTPMVSWRR